MYCISQKSNNSGVKTVCFLRIVVLVILVSIVKVVCPKLLSLVSFGGNSWFVVRTMLCGVLGSRVLGVRKAFLVLSRQIAPRNSLWGCLFVKKGLLGASSKRVLHNTYQGYITLGLLVFYLVFFKHNLYYLILSLPYFLI